MVSKGLDAGVAVAGKIGPIPRCARLPPSTPAARQRAALALALAAAVLSAGCGSFFPGPGGMLYVYAGIPRDKAENAEHMQGLRRQIASLEREFQRLHPATGLQLVLFPEESLAAQVRRRERSGLGPDLVLSNGDTSRSLAAQGLTRPVRMPDEVFNRLPATILEGLRHADGRLIALPVLQEPQLACFNRSRLPTAPRSTDELLALSAQGVQVGLSIAPVSLFWTSGSLGASDALVAAAAGATLSADQRQAVEGWTRWLFNASLQQRLTFYTNQSQLVRELQAGRAAWIPCRSTDLQELRKRLGTHLGVSVLPDGPRHQASPVTHLRVWSFGRNSSPRQRLTAEALASFSINPLMQRNITLGTQANLPVNRFVPVPVQSSEVLRVLVAAEAQSRYSRRMAAMLRGRPGIDERLQSTLSQLVFGELKPEQAASSLIGILESLR